MRAALQRILHHPRVEPNVSAWLRGRLVKETARFALREMTGSDSTHVYRVRAGAPRGIGAKAPRVLIAHGTPDVLTLDQAFYQHVYEPPDAVNATLRGLGRPLRALDLGANIGMWGLWLHGRFPLEHLTALEPDPENATKHRRQIALNDLGGSWELVQAAAGCSGESVAFTVGRATTGRIGEHGEQGTVEVAGRDVFTLLDGVDLLKIDIEGAEWPLLRDPRLTQIEVPVVMLEHHPHGAPSADPAHDAQQALAQVGYETRLMHGEPDGTGVVWGWKTV